ncbi:MAG: acetate kinase, partial [Natronospirillum sp.]
MSAQQSQLILVINSGSSSLKFSVFDHAAEHEIIHGLAERLGSAEASLHWQAANSNKAAPQAIPQADHQQALKAVLNLLDQQGYDAADLLAAGHRVVHGGEAFAQSCLIDDRVMAGIEALNHLAPLHNPANLQGIRALAQLQPQLPQVAVFDTAFHQSLPAAAYTYGVPYQLYEDHGVRRYGFHGTSHRYVSQEA